MLALLAQKQNLLSTHASISLLVVVVDALVLILVYLQHGAWKQQWIGRLEP